MKKLYRLGKINHIYPPEEQARINDRHAQLHKIFSGRDEEDIREDEREEYAEWKKLSEQLSEILLGTKFVEDPEKVTKLSHGEVAAITELTIPDDYPLFDHLVPFTGKTVTVTYRIPANILWKHLGADRDWTLQFKTLSRGFEKDEAEIIGKKKTEFTVNTDHRIELYYPGRISRFYRPQDMADLKKKFDTLAKLREKRGSDEAMQRWDGPTYNEWLGIKDIGNGIKVYVTEEDARKATGKDGELDVFTISESSRDILDMLRDKQDADTSFTLSWPLLWDNVVQGKEWTHEQRTINRGEGERGQEGKGKKVL